MSAGQKGTEMHRHAFTLVVVAAAAAALVGCNNNPPQSSDKPAGQVAAEQPSPSKLTDPGETSAPFVLSLKGPETPPDSGDIELSVTITAPREFKVPGTLKVLLPTGAKLISGSDSESLASIPAGETTRIFRVSLGGKLGVGQQIKVVLDARLPNNAAGAHAERLYPELVAPQATKPSSRVPPPPISRPIGVAPQK